MRVLGLRKRVKVVADALQFTQLYVEYHASRVALLTACMKGNASVLADLMNQFSSPQELNFNPMQMR